MKEQQSYDIVIIGEESILLNRIIYQIMVDKKISAIFKNTFDEGIRCIEKYKVKLAILDSELVSKLKPSSVMQKIKGLRCDVFFINTSPDMWINEVRKENVQIYKRPLIVDSFLKKIERIVKNKRRKEKP